MRIRLIILALMPFLLVGCTSNQLLLSALYNRMDNMIATEVKEYASFSSVQKREIDLYADQYHQWHRTQHLPLYAELLREVSGYLTTETEITITEVTDWSALLEDYAREMAFCYPMNDSSDFLKTLTDKQVEQILAHGLEEYEEFLEDNVDFTDEKRNKKRYDDTRKWFRRMSLRLNDEQKEQLKETIAIERRLGGSGMEVWKDWHLEFVDLLGGRATEDFAARSNQHIENLWTLQDDNFPEVFEFNRQHWAEYFTSLAQSLTDSQREDVSRWMIKMANNLDVISTLRVNEEIRLAPNARTCPNPYGLEPGNSENRIGSLSE